MKRTVLFAALIGLVIGVILRLSLSDVGVEARRNLEPPSRSTEPVDRPDPHHAPPPPATDPGPPPTVKPIAPQPDPKRIVEDYAMTSRVLGNALGDYDFHDARYLFLLFYGEIPVRPLGVSMRQVREWQATTTDSQLPGENYSEAMTRLSVLNRSAPLPISLASDFVAIGYADGPELEVIPNPIRTYGLVDPRLFLAKQIGLSDEALTPGQRDVLNALCDDFVVNEESVRRRSWELAAPEFARMSAAELHIQDVSGFIRDNRGLFVFQKGDDPRLDALVSELTTLREETVDRVREALRE